MRLRPRGISAALRRWCIALSAQIMEMEAYLGTKLVERTRQNTLLTQKGEEVLRHVRSILHQVDLLEQTARKGGGTPDRNHSDGRTLSCAAVHPASARHVSERRSRIEGSRHRSPDGGSLRRQARCRHRGPAARRRRHSDATAVCRPLLSWRWPKTATTS
jgi:hypothetical protein